MWTEKLRKLIEGKIKSDWVLTPLSAIDFGDNSNAFKPPVDGSPWIRVSIDVFGSENAEVGKRFQKHDGLIVVQCFVKTGSGESFVNKMNDAIGTIFQNKDFMDGVNKLSCDCMSPVYVGDKDNWFQKNAKVTFRYDVFSQ